MPPFSIIAAASLNNGIGIGSRLPWRLPTDLEYFRRVSTDLRTGKHFSPAEAPANENAADGGVARMNVIIMGRKTWESIPKRMRPLDGRINIVVSRDAEYGRRTGLPEFVPVCTSLEAAFAHVDRELAGTAGDVYVVGGGQIYADAIKLSDCTHVFLTRVYVETLDADAFFPQIPDDVYVLMSSGEVTKLLQPINNDGRFKTGTLQENGITYEFLVYQRS